MRLQKQTVGQGLPLVLLHGWGMDSHVWQALLPGLTTHFQVHMIDLPGFGMNIEAVDSAQDYTLQKIASEVLEIAPPRAIWLGWSLGGMIAMQVAVLQPHRIMQLVTIASTPKFVASEGWPGVQAERLSQLVSQLSTQYQKTLKQFIALQFFQLEKQKKHARAWQDYVLSQQNINMEALHGGLALLSSLDLRSQLIRITCPCHYLFGKLDVLVPVSVVSEIKKLQPGCQTYIIDRASHAPFISHPERVLSILNELAVMKEDE